MKNLTIAFATCVLMASCQYVAGDHENDDSTNTSGSEFLNVFASDRDTTIDSSNAYNNLFLDAALVEQYIRTNKLSAVDSQALKGFYNLRNYQYAWFAKDGLTEQGRAFWNLYTYSGRSSGSDSSKRAQNDQLSDKQLVARMDSVVEEDSLMIAASDSSFQHNEVALTHRFIKYYLSSAKQEPIHQIPLKLLVPVRKTDAKVVADSILSYNAADTTAATMANEQFEALKKQLTIYDSIADKGGWQPISNRIAMLKKGIKTPEVIAIKKRLYATGEYGSDTTDIFNDSLDVAIRSYQERNGFKPDGVISDSLIAVMNLPVEHRIQQILINMNRMAWMPPQIKDHFVEVNIPEFMLEVHEGDSIPVKMEVVVGKEGTNTMMFTRDMNQVVFSPSWNVPESIVKEEVLPAMKKDPQYLKRKNMEIISKNDSIPEIKQLPGPGNQLGKVKFLFPNTYDIYLHDTEAKGLFTQQKRMFSHGCIRLADAQQLSQYVLRNDNNWTPDKIKTAMNNNKEQTVAVKDPIPVVITYYTTFVDEKGRIHFREDVYQHDKRTRAMMFKANSATA